MKKVRYTPSVAKNLAAVRPTALGILRFNLAFTAPAPSELPDEVIEAVAERQARASMAIEGRRVERPLEVRSTAEARRAVAEIFEAGARRHQGRGPGADNDVL